MDIEKLAFDWLCRLYNIQGSMSEEEYKNIKAQSVRLGEIVYQTLFLPSKNTVFKNSNGVLTEIGKISDWNTLTRQTATLKKRLNDYKTRGEVEDLVFVFASLDHKFTKDGQRLFDLLDKIIGYLRAITLLLESAKHETHNVKNILHEKCLIPNIEKAIDTIRTIQQNGLDEYDIYDEMPSYSSMWKSPYPVQRYQQRIRELEAQIKALTNETEQ